MRTVVGIASLAAIAIACLGWAGAWAADKREFLAGYAGSLPTDPSLKARTYFDTPAVRNLIYALERGPAKHDDVIAALKGTGITPRQLLRVHILRKEGDSYFIGFGYFNRKDMRRIHAVTEAHVPSLVAAYASKRSQFARLWKDYPVDSVPDNAVGYALIAGFSLNWDALELTKELGYRKPQMVKGKNWQYSFWASEIVPGQSTLGYYWGSSTFPGGPFNYETNPVDYSFSSFGDPESSPRMDFPDLFFTPAAAMAPDVRKIVAEIGLVHETSLGLDIEDVLGLEAGRAVGTLLFRLRSKPMNETQLRAVLPDMAAERLAAILALLVETQYVEKSAKGMYRLIAPVLDDGDRAMVEATLALSRAILAQWLRENYPVIVKELAGLTATRHGVPFESLFTQIWHELFGLTTRELVASGFLADPRGDARRHKGSLPVVWRLSLYDLQPG